MIRTRNSVVAYPQPAKIVAYTTVGLETRRPMRSTRGQEYWARQRRRWYKGKRCCRAADSS
eukprot:2250700-Pyramimonas_sp.AAC.1